MVGGLWFIAACGGEGLTPEAPPVASAPSPPLLTQVRLPLLELEQDFRWDDELRGLVTMAVELGLSDLPGVLVSVPGQAQPPSVLTSLPASRRYVDARLVARGPDTDLELELELCVAGEGCVSSTARGTREAPWDAIGALLEGAAATLGAPVSADVVASWHRPGAPDVYAELLTGRAAATLYGILPPPDAPDDKRRNPVLRAVFLDPKQPLALWTLARWQVGTTSDGGAAVETLARASMVRPTSPTFDADRATLLSAQGKTAQALLAWEQLGARDPTDPRWFEPSARALLTGGRPAEARARLARFPAEFRWEPRVAELRVAVAELLDDPAALDPLLAHWQETDPKAVAPVRRRIEARVANSAFESALQLVPALRLRAPGPQTDALEVALLVAVGRPRDAATHAPADVAARLIARADRERDPGAPVPGLGVDDATSMYTRAEGMVWRGEAADALTLLDAVIEVRPWKPEAHAARARALERLGRGDEAAAAWQRAWELDPGLEGGPVTAARIANTFQFAVREAPVALELQPPLAYGPEP